MAQPSLRALRAFAETIRCGTLAGASSSLNVTPSAVSHLLRELEQTLGLPLLTSRARPTDTGEHLGRRLIAAFDAIDSAVAAARHQTDDIRISTLSTYLTLWLVPRLAGFQQQFPKTRLLFSTSTRPVDLVSEPFECAIRWGRGPWPGLECFLLSQDRPVVVTNPRLADARNLPRLAARSRPDDWKLVADALGWPDVTPTLTFETRALAVQAAIAGMGAAVVDRNLVSEMIQSGIICEIAPEPPVPVAEGHWFVALPDRIRDKRILQFRDWLIKEARQ